MKELRIIFCGDRKWSNRDLITFTMRYIRDNIGTFTVVEGEAPGADTISRLVAELTLNLPYDPHPANWTFYGRVAGPIRNTKMLKSPADAVVAFHNDFSRSKGTADMLKQAAAAGIPTWINTDGPTKLAEFIIQLRRIQMEEK